MVFSAIEHTGKVPFKHVLITGIVRDEQGRKMSKSLDNGVDPLDVIDHYGADALRFFLVNGNSPGNDLRYFESRVEASRNFANKLWNASRLVLMNVDDNFVEKDIKDINLRPEDKWILHKLNQTILSIDKQLDKFEIGLYSNEIYEFIWYEFCDWYLEMVKYRLYDEDVDVKNDAVNVLVYTLDKVLKLLHPIMPFITEEIYQHLPVKDEALIIASWPKYQEAFDFKETYDEIEFTKEIIKSIRNLRAEMNLPNKKKTNMLYYTEDDFEKSAIENNSQQILTLANCQTVKFEDKAKINPDEHSVLLVGKAEVFLPLKELIDREKEIERLTKEKEKAISEIERVNSKLANQGFVSKAPEKLINEERAKKETYETMLKNINLQLEKLNK